MLCRRTVVALKSKATSRYFHKAVGIVGMPNVGKSTMFNALTQSANAQAANYPFCTIEPNVAKVAVPDSRLVTLANVAQSKKVIETQIEFVDIAGLVRGASKGEGLGNKFLENIRQVSVIAHVLRCFDNEDIIHVEESVNPLRDLDTIQTELLLSDLLSIERQLGTAKKNAARNSRDKEKVLLAELLSRTHQWLEEGNPGRSFSEFRDDTEEKIFHQLQLLTGKPSLYICNVGEDDASTGNDYTKSVMEHVATTGDACLNVSASLEESAIGFDDDASKMEYLSCYDLTETGLTQILRACQNLLKLQAFYTVGPAEARAWSIPMGATAPEAAGVIHSDFEKHFIRAETIDASVFIEHGGEKGAKAAGLMRLEGRDYQCQDGDVFHFLTSA